jgi:CHAT domain-containing protein
VVRAMVAELLTALDAEEYPRDRDRRLTGLLGWLWDVIAAPVLSHLGIDQRLAPGAAGPRLWWCPAGLLSFLPLHAAGHHRTGSDATPLTVLDRAVCSYLPTVRVLKHARRAAGEADGRHADRGRTVVVVPDPAGLPGTAKEAALLGKTSSAEILAGANASRSAVLSALGRSQCVHFACHALSNLEDPSQSYVELHDHAVRPLTVADVASLRLTDARLAFLSACSTYQGGLALADEAIHLGSAFQLAGYRHVIATLWPTLDSPPTVRITRSVYSGIEGPAGVDATANALHAATRDERDRAPDAPSAWAAHIHCGG